MTTFDIAALGNAIVDVIAPTDDAFLLKHNIAKSVMTLIDEVRAQSLYKILPGGREIAGGSAANTLAGIASFGGQGHFVGRVKKDRLGTSFAASMAQTGVDFSTQMATSGASTACCLIAVTPDGQRSMNTYLGASRELTASDIDEEKIARAKVLYIEGYLWDTADAKDAITRAITIAKRAGNKVALTLSDPFCVGRWRDEFLHLWKNDLDILFANEEEAKALFEAADFDAALQTARRGDGVLALTRSEKGCVVADGSELHVLDAAPVAQVVDTTGAGDQFAAGFLFGLTHGKPLDHCGRLGGLAAAEVISHYGARPEVKLAELAAKAGLS